MTPAGLSGILKAEKTCEWCQKSKESIGLTPDPDAVPVELRGLSEEAYAALSPIEYDCGPKISSVDALGRRSGYRQHSRMMTFAWHEKAVEERIDLMESRRMQERTRAALEHAMRHMAPYRSFKEEHDAFLRNNPGATAVERKRWLNFIERPCLERLSTIITYQPMYSC